MTSPGWASEPRPPHHTDVSAAAVTRHLLLWTSRRDLIRRAVVAAPLTRAIVARFVAGETIADAIEASRSLTSQGLLVSLDHLGEDTHDAAAAQSATRVYLELAARLADEGLADRAEMSVKLSALGQAVDPAMAEDNAHSVCAAARAAGTSVTVDMEDHTTTDATLGTVRLLRREFPATGAVLQASLQRSEEDCRGLAAPGSRVRLCKGAYQEPAAIAWQRRGEVRSAYLRCLRILIAGGAYTMAATHDPLLVGATGRLVTALGTPGFAHEYQMLHGIRPDEQRRLMEAGERVRVYVPFGVQWYGYLMRRMAERPANAALVLRALGSRR